MADGAFAISVVTPERLLLSGEATAVILRSSDGNLTVLDGHTPLITDVVPGQVRVERAEGETDHLAVHGGYLQVEKHAGERGAGDGGPGTRVTLLVGVAELAGDIDVARAETARDRARQKVEQLRASGARDEVRGPAVGSTDDGTPAVTPEDVELAEAEATLRRAEVRLEVAGATV